MNKSHSFYIDPDAKCRINLRKIEKDANGQPYYVGKFQWPGTMDFENGALFMVFLSEEDCEELQISPLDPNRRVKNKSRTTMSNGRISINLYPKLDRNNNTYYVGEAVGHLTMDLIEGVFFTIFTSREGAEEIQISRLRAPNRKKLPDDSVDNYEPDIEYQHQGWQENSASSNTESEKTIS
jgi:hypothetical protein